MFILIYDSTENNRVITCILASVNPIFIANSSLQMKKKKKKARDKYKYWQQYTLNREGESHKYVSNEIFIEMVRVRKMGSETRLWCRIR